MANSIIDIFKRYVQKDPSRKYWLWQGGYWIFVSITSFVILTLWYGPFGLPHVLHILVQGVYGIILSMTLYWLFLSIWSRSARYRITVVLVSVMIAAFVWTLLRVQAFIWLTGEVEEWEQLGGWHFASIFIFSCWTCLFHGVRYNDLLQDEHEILLQAESDARKEQIKRMQAQNEARDAQLKMLRYQLNPHFLCNTLNAISSLVEAEETDKAQNMTVQLSRFLRHSLDNNPDTKITLENEVKALNLYLEIEKTRFEDRLELDFSVSEEAKSALVPSLLLQPIIENSMKHAIAQSEMGGTISMRARIVAGNLELTLSDTGAGNKIAKTKLQSSKGRGVGLKNTDQRLHALYDNSYDIQVNFLPSGGLTTVITIPCEYPIKASKRVLSPTEVCS